MEYLDIVDKETGKRTGSVCDRKTAHQKGYWHKVAHVWVFNKKGEILIQKRSGKKESNPNKWTLSCGGHVSSGSSSLETAVIELEEELGLAVDAEKLKFIYSYKRKKDIGNYKSRHILDVFLLVCDINLLELRLQDEEVSEVSFISIDEYRKKISEKNTSYMDYTDELEQVLKKFKA